MISTYFVIVSWRMVSCQELISTPLEADVATKGGAIRLFGVTAW